MRITDNPGLLVGGPLYRSVNDVPKPLCDILCSMREKGMPVEEIAYFFEMSEEWVRIITDEVASTVKN